MIAPQITPKRFYNIGIICFTVMASISLYYFIRLFPLLEIPEMISRTFGILWDVGLIGLFLYLKKQLPPEIKENATDDEINKILRGLDENNKPTIPKDDDTREKN